ncbi:MAG: MFS transporter [Candidatus Nanopelagicales bacterium]
MARSKDLALTAGDRRIVLGASIALAGILTLNSTFNYMLPDMVADFGASTGQSALMRQISSLGALLVVFLAGVLGERLGERRVIIWAAGLFAIGSAVVAVSPVFQVAGAGLLAASIGKSVMSVLGVAYVAAAVQDPARRATAFSAVSSVQPMAYLVLPLLAGLLLSAASWRAVSIVWVLGGIAALVAAQRLFPKDAQRTRVRGEMLTPALAGLLLAAFVQIFGTLKAEGATTQFWVLSLVIGLTMIALVIAYRRLANPTLSLAPLKHGGLMLLFLVVILITFANLYYYSTLLFEVNYAYSPLGAAVLMMPAQVAGIGGAVVVRKLLQSRGITFSGGVMLSIVAAALLLCMWVSTESPLWVPIAIVSLFGFASVSVIAVMTNAVMNLSPRGKEGDTSAYRSAASNMGLAVGVAVMTAVVTTVGMASITSQMSAAGMSTSEYGAAATALLDGTSPQDVSDQYGIPIDEAQELDDIDRQAFVSAYRAQGLVGGLVTAAAACLFLGIRRRMDGRDRAAH